MLNLIVARIDENGFFIEDVLLKDEEEIAKNHVLTRPNTQEKGFYRAKWTGVEWIEDMSQSEIDTLNNQSIEPTEIEKIKIRQDATEDALLFIMGKGVM